MSDVFISHQSLVDQLKQAGAIRTTQVDAALRAVPCDLFLPDVLLDKVYSDEVVVKGQGPSRNG